MNVLETGREWKSTGESMNSAMVREFKREDWIKKRK